MFANFSYKFWSVYISEGFFGKYDLSFKIDSFSISVAILQLAKEDNIKLPKMDIKDSYGLLKKQANEIEFSIKVRHFSGDALNLCKKDAIEYIDNNLGNGFDYARKKDLFISFNRSSFL